MLATILAVTLPILISGRPVWDRIRVDGETFVFRDGSNRTRLFHGTNFVTKSGDFLPKVSEATIEDLKLIGANVVRLGVMMPGVFPTPDAKPNSTYLSEVERIIDLLWNAGIASVIDLHQDVLSPIICGEGTPQWMLNASTLNSLPFPEPVRFSNTSKPDPHTGSWAPKQDCEESGPLKSIGWSMFYATDACGKAFQQMYDGVGVLGKMVVQHWRTVASQLQGKAGILAYEMLNEPWVGDHISHPELLTRAGKAEGAALGSFMQKIHQVIREVDAETPILFAPAEVNNRLMRRVGYENGFLPHEPMAFHVYCMTGTDGDGPTTWLSKSFCHLNDGFQLSQRRSDIRRLRTAGIVTEFGAVSDTPTGLAEVRFVAEHLDGDGSSEGDKMPLSWIYWDKVPPATDYRRELARSYPRAVAGDVASLKFDATNGDFTLKFWPSLRQQVNIGENVTCASTPCTEIFLSKDLHYENGFSVTTEPDGCCNVEETPGVGINVLVLDHQMKEPAELVTVSVKRR